MGERKLKTVKSRIVGMDIVTKKPIAREVARRTGFQVAYVHEICSVFLEVLREELIKGKKIQLQEIGSLFTYLIPPRVRTHFKDKKAVNMEAKARYVTKFYPSDSVNDELKEKEVTKEEIDKMYD